MAEDLGLPDQTLPNLIYAHCRTIFEGANAKIREMHIIKTLIQQHQGQLTPLLSKYPLDVVCVTVHDLLQRGFFESLPDANQRPLENFPASRRELNASAERSDQEKTLDQANVNVSPLRRRETVSHTSDEPKTGPMLASSANVMSFPWPVQRKVFASIQSALEQCCFEYAKRWLPDLVASESWETFQRIGLTEWGARLKVMENTPANTMSREKGKTWWDVLLRVRELRHSNIHRDNLTASDVIDRIENATMLMKVLNDGNTASWILEIKEFLSSYIAETKQRRQAIEKYLSAELETVSKKRKELDQTERNLISRAIQWDQENQHTILFKWMVPDFFHHRSTLGSATINPMGPPTKKIKLDDGTNTFHASSSAATNPDSHTTINPPASPRTKSPPPKVNLWERDRSVHFDTHALEKHLEDYHKAHAARASLPAIVLEVGNKDKP